MCTQGCINRSILPSGMGARGVSSEHVEMFSGSPLRCSPVLQLRCALVLGEPCSGSQRTVLWFSENRALVLGEPCSGSQRTVFWFSENRAPVLGELFSNQGGTSGFEDFSNL